MTTDPGYSSVRNLLDSGGYSGYQNIFSKLGLMLVKIPETIRYKFSQGPSKGIKEIGIIINFLN